MTIKQYGLCILYLCISFSVFSSESLTPTEITNSSDSELQDIMEDPGYTEETRDAAETEWNERQIAAEISRAEEALMIAQALLEQANEKISQISSISAMSNADINRLSEAVAEARATVEAAREKLEALTVGDPVLITSGKYEQKDIDLWSKKAGSLVTRRYVSGDSFGLSLGNVWTTNLDSRIIRGTTPIDENDLLELKNLAAFMFEKWQESIPLIEDNSDCQTYTDELFNYFTERNTQYLMVKNIRDRALLLSSKNKSSIHKNINEQWITTGNETLVYIDDNGNPITFRNKKNGVWQPQDPSRAQYMKLKSLDGQGAETNEGFVIEERGKNKKYFNGDGLISKIESSNSWVKINRKSDSQKIETIVVSNGIIYSFTYENETLKKIYSEQTDEEILYEYDTNGRLTSVIDTDGDCVKYSYIDNLLTHIIKNDGSTTTLQYGIEDQEGTQKISNTINEVGAVEYYNYFPIERSVVYKNPSDIQTIYTYSEKQQIIREQIAHTHDIEYFYDPITNVLTRRIVNGVSENYYYDTRGNREKIEYSDGSTEIFLYNASDELISYTDRDGIFILYEYDDNGNVVKIETETGILYTARYDDETKLLIESTEGSTQTKNYFYDDYQYVSSIQQYVNGNLYIEYFEHDKRGRLLVYINAHGQKTQYSYTKKTTTIETPTFLQKIITTNGRKDIVSIVDVDLKTGEKREQKILYDNRHLPVKIIEADGTIRELVYRGDGLQIQHTLGKWHEHFLYDESGRLLEKIHSMENFDLQFREQYMYENTNYGERISKFSGSADQLWARSISNFDAWKRITEFHNALGEKDTFHYTHAGKLLLQTNSFGGTIEKKYSSDGRLFSDGKQGKKGTETKYTINGLPSIITNTRGEEEKYYYDELSRITKKEIPQGKFYFVYDEIGRVTSLMYEENNGTYIYKKKYEYDDENRIIIETTGDHMVTKMFYDAWGQTVSIIDGEENEKRFEYDKQGRMVSQKDGYGNKTFYSWNEINLIDSIRYPNGLTKEYTYDYNRKLVSIKDNNGFLWYGKYDQRGRLIDEYKRPGKYYQYLYDDADRLTHVSSDAVTIARYRYEKNGQRVIYIDGNNNEYTYVKDDFGQLVLEINRLKNHSEYMYDDENFLIEKQNFIGTKTNHMYESDKGRQYTKYYDGSEINLTKSGLADVLSAEAGTGNCIYTYSTSRLLTSQYDVGANEVTTYEYDRAGRRILMKSGNRYVRYRWGKNNELLSITDSGTNVSITFEYDVMNRETKRIFANGVTQYTYYDTIGNCIAISEIDERNTVLRSEGYVYDDLGRRVLSINEEGYVTKYVYNSLGFVTEIFYPYSESLAKIDKEEAINSLLFISSDRYVPLYANFSTEEIRSLESVINLFGNYAQVRHHQLMYKISYSYDSNGNRSSKTSQWGTLSYVYDAENKLLSRGETIFSYDLEGNLLSEKSLRKEAIYTYTASNRMMSATVSDSVVGTRLETSFSYDAFGRRTLRYEEGLGMRTLYDGLSFDVIRDEATFFDSSFISSSQDSRNTSFSSHLSSSSRYRFLDSSSSGSISDEVSPSIRFRKSSIPLYVNGKVASMSDEFLSSSTFPDGFSRTRYFGSDVLSSVRSATSASGTLDERYEYDIFGTPYEGDLYHKGDLLPFASAGYTGKPYDSLTGMYDYGYRDYTPTLARFTTIDPIRDGNNWFSYTNNDPINFTDLWGLELEFLVDKDTQTLTATITINGFSVTKTIDVTTGVVSQDPVPNSDTTRTQNSGTSTTNPTQFPNGTNDITGTKPNPTTNSNYGTTWITTDATQILTDTSGKQVVDGGYQIHLTNTSNTNGCIGIKNINDMNQLINMVKINELLDPGTSSITVTGGVIEKNK